MDSTQKRPRRDQAKEQFWRKTLARWRRSKQGGREFCAAESLKEASFYAWRKELVRRDEERAAVAVEPSLGGTRRAGVTRAAPAFVSLQLAPAQMPLPAVGSPLELVLPTGHVLRIPPGCDRDTLAAVLAVLHSQALGGEVHAC